VSNSSNYTKDVVVFFDGLYKGCSLNKEYNFFTCGKKYVVGLNKEIIKDEKKRLKR